MHVTMAQTVDESLTPWPPCNVRVLSALAPLPGHPNVHPGPVVTPIPTPHSSLLVSGSAEEPSLPLRFTTEERRHKNMRYDETGPKGSRPAFFFPSPVIRSQLESLPVQLPVMCRVQVASGSLRKRNKDV